MRCIPFTGGFQYGLRSPRGSLEFYTKVVLLVDPLRNGYSHALVGCSSAAWCAIYGKTALLACCQKSSSLPVLLHRIAPPTLGISCPGSTQNLFRDEPKIDPVKVARPEKA